MHPEKIKARIRMSGDTQSGIARRLKVSANAVRLVILGHGRSDRIATEIARVVGQEKTSLWPSIYRSDKEAA